MAGVINWTYFEILRQRAGERSRMLMDKFVFILNGIHSQAWDRRYKNHSVGTRSVVLNASALLALRCRQYYCPLDPGFIAHGLFAEHSLSFKTGLSEAERG